MKFIILSLSLFALASASVITGGKHRMDVNDVHLAEIMRAVEPKINAKLSSPFFHRVGKVLEAESQVVSGVLYHVKFELGQTECRKEKATNFGECKALGNVQTCSARILSQPWLNNLEVTHLECAAPVAAEYFDHVSGAAHKIAVNDAHMLEALAAAEPQINDRLNSMYYHRIGKVVAAEAQVVSGVKYHVTFELGMTQCLKSKMTKDSKVSECAGFSHVQVCKAQIWSQVWLHHTEITEIHCEAQKPVATFYSEIVEAEVVGGQHDLDVNDVELHKVLKEVEVPMNDKIKNDNFWRIGKVLSAKTQVVSGINYIVSFEIGQTQCAKAKVTKATNLDAECKGFDHVQICSAKIWSQVWLHHTEIMDIKCHLKTDVPSPHDIPGGKHLIDVDNKQMLAALHAVEHQMSNALNSPFVHQVTKVTSVSSQVVSGVLYHIDFEFGTTKCTKSHPELEGCKEVTANHHCHAEIQVQSWLNKTVLHKFHCDN